MKYDDQAAAWAAMHLLSDTPPYKVAHALGGNSAGLTAMMARFCGVEDSERWRLHALWRDEVKALLKPALAAYCDKAGIAPGDRLSPGRPLVPPRSPKPKVAKPIPLPDTSEYGLAKGEYLKALERLKAAKARRGEPNAG
jgi:hypothetical protein